MYCANDFMVNTYMGMLKHMGKVIKTKQYHSIKLTLSHMKPISKTRDLYTTISTNYTDKTQFGFIYIIIYKYSYTASLMYN